ncbi:MAG: alpha/beta hydrolase, partial [Anaerolineae bacterium]|nr:alpha/beta hydrolase [Anaerolineae bacterium]
MKAIEPTESGHLTVQGFEIFYELFGDPQASPLLCIPTWQIAPSCHWKMQIPYLARYFRVITWDPPGIGGAERTTDPAAFECDRVVDYAIGLLDHLGIEQTDVIGLSMGGTFGLWLAARYPERVKRAILIGSVPPEWAYGEDPTFWIKRDAYHGWQKRNANYWREDYEGWLDFFFTKICSEPHSTKSKEDFINWARETTPEILISSVINKALMPEMPLAEAIERVRCPIFLIHGTDDQIAPVAYCRKLAATRPDWDYLEMEESCHAPHWRNPVRTNIEIANFLGVPQPKQRTWRRSMSRRRPKALFVCSPIGLGHAQRDIAIANELRRLVPELQIEWLAQHPVTNVLEANGETIHPMSKLLVSESAHWESCAGEHQLHCFYAWRNMDEILLANFMVFLEAVRETPYDVWIGDEAWEVDYYLHENPEVKTAPYVFLTDFLGWLPIDRSPGSRDVFLTTDYNAEMIEHIARYPRVRDRAIYIGDYDDLIPESFGANLPLIPDWTREHFEAVGYITPFDPADYADTQAVRQRLGYDPDEALVFLT